MKNLAIIAPQIGAYSESFIRRHMEELLPGRTVVITLNGQPPENATWTTNTPVLTIQPHLLSTPTDFSEPQWKSIYRKVLNRPNYYEQNYLNFVSFLKENNVGVIMGEYINLSHPWIEIVQKLNIPFFSRALGFDISYCLRKEEWKKKYLDYNQTEGIITVNKVSCQKLINIGIKPEKIHVVPCGAEVPIKPIIRESKEKINCIAVGRMVGKKAPLMMLNAFRLACEQQKNLHLDYIGTGPLLPAVRQFINIFNLEEKITIHLQQPYQSYINMIKKSDIFLQHSMTDFDTGDEEGLPVAILEAMAHSLPVVSTRHAGIPEAVEEGNTGFLVDEGDSVTMSEYIIKLAQNYELRQEMGKAAWERTKNAFSWEIERTRLLEIMGLS